MLNQHQTTKTFFYLSPSSTYKAETCICFLDTQGYVLVYTYLTKTMTYYLLMLNTFMAASSFKDTLHNYEDEFYVLIWLSHEVPR